MLYDNYQTLNNHISERQLHLLDRTFDLNKQLSNNENNLINLVVSITDRNTNINTLKLIIDSGFVIIGVITTAGTCSLTPSGTTSAPCVFASTATIWSIKELGENIIETNKASQFIQENLPVLNDEIQKLKSNDEKEDL